MEKKFKTIHEQIEILKSKNLNITDFDNTYEMLSRNNHYYLINGYKKLFLDTKSETEKYINNIHINEIYALYIFDKNIKINFLKYVLLLETEIDTFMR